MTSWGLLHIDSQHFRCWEKHREITKKFQLASGNRLLHKLHDTDNQCYFKLTRPVFRPTDPWKQSSNSLQQTPNQPGKQLNTETEAKHHKLHRPPILFHRCKAYVVILMQLLLSRLDTKHSVNMQRKAKKTQNPPKKTMETKKGNPGKSI